MLALRLMGIAPESRRQEHDEAADDGACLEPLTVDVLVNASSPRTEALREEGVEEERCVTEQPSQPRIVAVDKFEMEPIAGVVQVQGDITHESTVRAVRDRFEGEAADLVVCDGAPDATGRSDFDEYVQHQLVLSEVQLASALLRPGGAFVAKVFRGEHAGEVYAYLGRLFREVLCCKPRASRNSSQEVFVVCRDFAPPASFDRAAALYVPARHEELADLGPGAARLTARFVACGDDRGMDADTNYAVPRQHRVLGPVAPPISAPYQAAIEERRGQKRASAASVDDG